MSITVPFFLFRPLLDEDLVAFALMMDDLAAFCRSRHLSLLRCQLCLDLHILHTSTCAYLSGHVAFSGKQTLPERFQ